MSNFVVFNDCFGGFGLSSKAKSWLKGQGLTKKEILDIPRHHPLLVRCVKLLEDKANGPCAKLAIKEIEGNTYRIDEYDGWESVMEPNSYEWIVIN